MGIIISKSGVVTPGVLRGSRLINIERNEVKQQNVIIKGYKLFSDPELTEFGMRSLSCSQRTSLKFIVSTPSVIDDSCPG